MKEPHDLHAALADFELRLDGNVHIRLLQSADARTLYDATIKNREHIGRWMRWPDAVIDVSDTDNALRFIEKELYEDAAFTAENLGATDNSSAA
ncbi:MAG: hypothetical protein ABR508_02875 [Candidatus Baltobacteraceae bacterium]